jgi:hypothetical protein
MTEPRIDNAHVPHNPGLHQGQITQKIEMGGQSMHIETPVDAQGNVGTSNFVPGK